jgi:Ca2+-binding EF-hand superfamily protein
MFISHALFSSIFYFLFHFTFLHSSPSFSIIILCPSLQDKDGFISIAEFCDYIGESSSPYWEHIFSLTDAVDEEGRLDFGETIKSLCTFSMLNGDEILRLVFSKYDPDGLGFISPANVLDLLSILHPHYRKRPERALKEFDLPKHGKIKFENLLELHTLYPNMFYPAFRCQAHVRQKFFGLRWWEKKLRRYMKVKEKLNASQMTSQMMDQGRAKQAERGEAKKARKNMRIKLARVNKSSFVRALYVAKNVADTLIPDVDIKGRSLNPFTNYEEEEVRKRKEAFKCK